MSLAEIIEVGIMYLEDRGLLEQLATEMITSHHQSVAVPECTDRGASLSHKLQNNQ